MITDVSYILYASFVCTVHMIASYLNIQCCHSVLKHLFSPHTSTLISGNVVTVVIKLQIRC
jgi:hypothetical protein